jgi:hypothetical protein
MKRTTSPLRELIGLESASARLTAKDPTHAPADQAALDRGGRRPRKRTIDVYLGVELDDYVRALADKSRTSVSAVCRDLISAAIKARKVDTADATVLLSVLETAMAQQTNLLRKLEVLGALNVSLSAMPHFADEPSEEHKRAKFAALVIGGLKGAGSVMRSDAIAAVVRARSEG